MRKYHSVANIEEDAKYMKLSFRQKGSEMKGSLYKGGVSSAFNKKTIGTIPSKYETILYPQNGNISKGFGSGSYRFSESVAEIPGPGAYIDPKLTASKCLKTQSDSYSKKGYGNGFISENERFRITNYNPYQTPGPTAYSSNPSEDSNKPLKSSPKGILPITEKYKFRNSPSFASKVPNSSTGEILLKIFSKDKTLIPGPGAYNFSRSLTETSDYKQCSPFKSQDERFKNEQKEQLPGPGHYELDIDAAKRKLLLNPLSSVADLITSANFKKPTLAKRVKVNLYDPFENIESEEKKSPGPGQYHSPYKTIEEKIVKDVHMGPTSSFAKPEIVNRFGQMKYSIKDEIKPGPGYYFNETNKEEPENPTKIESAIFKSKAKRIEYLDVKHGPGPALYNKYQNDKFVKETRNFNPEKEWI